MGFCGWCSRICSSWVAIGELSIFGKLIVGWDFGDK